ncbi:type IV pilus inner membrane component PilO [Methyloradius palustris]|uniref:Type 4 fimbrial biogenesis protein PilO n=1 Tax=Methyloradius palustris TaxID=2778876 RepID=A0A8D5GD29_9PROT|nr:type 4a pilus biogenesis protein PilO [Methyloradius palustris]BCM26071.1 type 4 fimbrial biogenesis protein PilO [Methyloradius palustris]
MKLEDFNHIDFKTAGTLPLPVKGVLLGILLITLVGVGYYFVWSPLLDDLATAKAKEADLREVFLNKKRQAINLDSYKQQMVDIEKTFGVLLKQLPDKSQMDGLLTDINQAGLERGLDFELFKPGQETYNGFYAELPIYIKVTGTYFDLGAFASDISKLSRIVTLNDISITSSIGKDGKESGLAIEATAKTYRYLDASEISTKKGTKK